MSRTAHKLLSASGSKGAYEIDQSLMFNDGDSAYLTRTPSSAGNLRTWTLSFWVKRSTLGALQILYSASNEGSGATDFGIIYFDANDALGFYYDSSTIALTNRKFRDVGAWYHIYIKLDTTQGTASDRWAIYINGVQETSFSESTTPSQNTDIAWNNNIIHYIGRTHGGHYFDGYIAEFHNIDGTAKAVGDFAETDSETGQWIPKKYGGGSYGTTGFYLKFVSGALGTDSSGSSNTWTANNLANADVMLDTPTNNFCTFNSLDNGSTVLSQGNLKFVNSSGNSDTGCTTQVPYTGKWYMELRLTAVDAVYLGIWTTNYTDTDGSEDYGTGKQINHTGGITGGSAGGYVSGGFANDDILSMALDCDNGKIWWAKNGTYPNSGNPATGSNQALTFTATDSYKILIYGNSGTQNEINFGQNGTFNGLVTAQGNADGSGQGNFYYAPPSGFKALCSQNLPTPAIKKSTDHFNTVLYTGNGSTQSITGVGHQPDWVWIKNRSATDNHKWTDVVRGVTKEIESNSNDAEATNADGLTAFGSDGFSLGDDDEYNTNTENYVSWNWKASNSSSSNEDGSINTTATSANTTSGFSVSTYTGTGSNATVGHGLGVVPSVIIIKNRGQTDDWAIYSRGDATDYLELNTISYSPIASTDDNTYWNDTAPTSSVFTIGTAHSVNASSETYVAYCFANVEGFFKSGTYVGNGEAEDGPYVITGFSPEFVIQKETSEAGGSWFMWDSKREVGNVKDAVFWADYESAETAHAEYEIDFLSNGFKIRGNSGGTNSSGQTNLYMAWAESPFKYATAR